MRYTREDGCRSWLTYGQLRSEKLQELLDEFGSAEAIYDRLWKKGEGFLKRRRINEDAVARLKKRAEPEAMHEMMVKMSALGAGIISQADEKYPDSLRSIPSPPALLFYQGSLDCLLGKCLTVVGSRFASRHGCEITRTICRDLSNAGVTIVSGLAMGIDAEAHIGCLEGGSPTAAVLACGLDVEYPVENFDLRSRILQSGGILLTEYPFGFRANKYVFRTRNRIMSGLGRALLMIEARIRSGSMITVHHALDQGRDVYAYPGIPGSEWSEGAHQLIREGAIYFTQSQDVLEDMGWLESAAAPARDQKEAMPALSGDERKIYTLLSRGPMTFDELASESGLPIPVISVSLTMLQLAGLVKSMPGKTYCRV